MQTTGRRAAAARRPRRCPAALALAQTGDWPGHWGHWHWQWQRRRAGGAGTRGHWHWHWHGPASTSTAGTLLFCTHGAAQSDP
eukprot:7028394-Alexandrium_andersonii.AAC.1